MKECDTQISCILREQQELQRKISETNLERKKMENEVMCLLSLMCLQYLSQDFLYFSTFSLSFVWVSGKTDGDGTKRLLLEGPKTDREACLDNI